MARVPWRAARLPCVETCLLQCQQPPGLTQHLSRGPCPASTARQQAAGLTVCFRAGRVLRPALAARIMQLPRSFISLALPARLPSSQGFCTAACHAALLLPQGCCTHAL